jgi:hypothetical protein
MLQTNTDARCRLSKGISTWPDFAGNLAPKVTHKNASSPKVLTHRAMKEIKGLL